MCTHRRSSRSPWAGRDRWHEGDIDTERSWPGTRRAHAAGTATRGAMEACRRLDGRGDSGGVGRGAGGAQVARALSLNGRAARMGSRRAGGFPTRAWVRDACVITKKAARTASRTVSARRYARAGTCCRWGVFARVRCPAKWALWGSNPGPADYEAHAGDMCRAACSGAQLRKDQELNDLRFVDWWSEGSGVPPRRPEFVH